LVRCKKKIFFFFFLLIFFLFFSVICQLNQTSPEFSYCVTLFIYFFNFYNNLDFFIYSFWFFNFFFAHSQIFIFFFNFFLIILWLNWRGNDSIDVLCPFLPYFFPFSFQLKTYTWTLYSFLLFLFLSNHKKFLMKKNIKELILKFCSLNQNQINS